MRAQEETTAASESAEALPEGEPLAHYLARVGRLPQFQGWALAAQLLSALDALHQAGLVHAAVDPSHLLVSRSGRLLVPGPVELEPRQVTLTPPNLPEATPYMAPEQALGLETDHRADLYASAVVIYELLTGTLPFEVRSPMAGPRDQNCTPRPVRALRPHLPAQLDPVFQRALAHRADDRYQSAAELSAAMQAALPAPCWDRAQVTSAPTCVDEPSEPARPSQAVSIARPHAMARKPLRRSRGRRMALGLAGCCVAAVVLVATLMREETSMPATASVAGFQAAGAGGTRTEQDRHPPAQQVEFAEAQSPGTSTVQGAIVDAPPGPPPAVESENPSPETAPSHPSVALGAPPASRPAAEARRHRVRLASARPADAGAHVRQGSTHAARAAQPSPESSCRQDLAFARDFCTAVACATAEFRQHPVCVRMHAEAARTRARLAEARGGP